MLIGIRGYYLDTMGKPGVNDRGLYDDALLLISPNYYETFNFNTDPSVYRPGIATLLPGLYPYKKGMHGLSKAHPYSAFRPATPGEQLPVLRDGVLDPKPGVAINIHRGGYNTTSSEGCQTVYPPQWLPFQRKTYELMNQYRQPTIDYLLIEQPW